MRKAVVFIVFALAFTAIGAYSYFRQHSQLTALAGEITTMKKAYEAEMEKADFELTVLKEDMRTCYESEHILIPPGFKVYEQGKTEKRLADIIRSNTLIVRFSELNCHTCVQAVFSLLEEMKIDSAVFLVDYTNTKYLKSFDRFASAGRRFYRVDSLNLPAEKFNLPYMFLSDKEMKTGSVFIPHKEMPEYTRIYLKTVRAKTH